MVRVIDVGGIGMNPITTLKELKDIEIDVLKRFIKFCNDNDLMIQSGLVLREFQNWIMK